MKCNIFSAWAATNWLTHRRYQKIIGHFGTLETAWQHATAFELMKSGLTKRDIDPFLEIKADIHPEKVAEQLQKLNIRLFFFKDKDYPLLLKEIPDLPVFLYTKGNLSALKNHRSIAVVGTRKFTSYGKRVTEELVKGLAEQGFCIVSGLALGIDSFAHEATLRQNGQTVAVLGSGLNEIYPVSNYHLARNIVEQDGLLVSQYPPNEAAIEYHFPQRNRIIAGLSRGTIVIEAAKKSGALITAHLALDYNRDVFAVPGSIFSQQSIGTNELIAKGEAKLITSHSDILEEFHLDLRKDKKEARIVKAKNELQQKILDYLALKSTVTSSEIIRELHIETSVINRELTMMELGGMVRRMGEGVISVSN